MSERRFRLQRDVTKRHKCGLESSGRDATGMLRFDAWEEGIRYSVNFPDDHPDVLVTDPKYNMPPNTIPVPVTLEQWMERGIGELHKLLHESTSTLLVVDCLNHRQEVDRLLRAIHKWHATDERAELHEALHPEYAKIVKSFPDTMRENARAQEAIDRVIKNCPVVLHPDVEESARRALRTFKPGGIIPLKASQAGCVTQLRLREELAAYAHKAWSGWMEYLFKKSEFNSQHGTVTIPQWACERWGRQSKTPYADLPEKEKESDRKEADKMLVIMKPDKKRLSADEWRPPRSPELIRKDLEKFKATGRFVDEQPDKERCQDKRNGVQCNLPKGHSDNHLFRLHEGGGTSVGATERWPRIDEEGPKVPTLTPPGTLANENANGIMSMIEQNEQWGKSVPELNEEKFAEVLQVATDDLEKRAATEEENRKCGSRDPDSSLFCCRPFAHGGQCMNYYASGATSEWKTPEKSAAEKVISGDLEKDPEHKPAEKLCESCGHHIHHVSRMKAGGTGPDWYFEVGPCCRPKLLQLGWRDVT